MKLQEIVGHQRPLAVIRGVLERGTAAPAYLFHGPEGIGKRTTALAFSAALLCEAAGGDACGSCRSCRLVGGGGHPDFKAAAPEKKALKIEPVREMQQFLSLKPAWGGRKVALIEEADSMTLQAANALLKTLEEPPRGTTIILISSNPAGLPPTVLSRCQRVSFGPLRDDDVREVLRRSGHSFEEDGPRGFLETGSPGSILAFEEEEWKKPQAAMEKILKALAKRDDAAVMAAVEGVPTDRKGLHYIVKTVLARVRWEIRLRFGLEEKLRGEPGAFLKVATDGDLLSFADGLLDASRALDGNANGKLVLGTLFTKWARCAGELS